MRFPMVGVAAAALSLGLAAPALADNDRTPPGNPCAKGNGNPCNGNNGNIGRQGNAGDKVKYDHKPPPIDIPLPAVSGRGAYVTQIGGSGNNAAVTQTAPNALAIVRQEGDGNETDITQDGSGLGYAQLSQSGTGNSARLSQDGSGQNVLYVTQTGTGNWLWSRQLAGNGAHNGAVLAQYGSTNDMLLVQDGSDNRALLTQNGDNNGMTAVQNGDGNRLIWTQNGNNLSDLGITQNGGQAIQITQTGGR